MRTTVGHLLLSAGLPEGITAPSLLDKKGLGQMLSEIAQKHPDRYGEVANHVKDVGNRVAYETGTSFTLADLKPDTKLRDAAFAAHHQELRRLIDQAIKTPAIQRSPAFARQKAELYAKIEQHVQQGVADRIKTQPNNLTAWIASGARGDTHMARQMLAMSGLNVDVAGKLAPDIAKRSFSEGLSPMDFHIHATGARRGVVNTYTSVREPGAFAKELNTIAADMVVTQLDCGTTRGRELPPADPDVLDRLLAREMPGVGHRNDLVDDRLRQLAIKTHLATLPVRSPLTCAAREGVCSRCYGQNEEGRIPSIGEHVGLRASTSITEPLTQLALQSKHSGGVVGAGKSPFHQILDVMHAPRELAGAAVLARHAGQVTRIDKAPSGGWQVHVDGTPHYLAPGLDPIVSVGQRLTRGVALSGGQPHPAQVVSHLGMERGREHFADTLRGLYGDAGIRGHGKIFETVSRAVLNLGQVVQPGKHDWIPGEIVHWNAVAPHLAEQRATWVPLDQAEGRILHGEAGHLGPYETLTNKHIAALRARKIGQVPVFSKDDLVVRPIMLGTERAALHKGDWLANLGFRFLGQTFRENAATGATASLHGWNPIPSLAHGAEFGKGEGGRY